MLCPLALGTVGMIAASLAATPSPPQVSTADARPQARVQTAPDASPLAPPAGRKPYAVVFTPRQPVDSPQVDTGPSVRILGRGRPAVVCGMVIFDADPAVDARIRIPLPNADVEHAIKRIPPPACGGSDR